MTDTPFIEEELYWELVTVEDGLGENVADFEDAYAKRAVNELLMDRPQEVTQAIQDRVAEINGDILDALALLHHGEAIYARLVEEWGLFSFYMDHMARVIATGLVTDSKTAALLPMTVDYGGKGIVTTFNTNTGEVDRQHAYALDLKEKKLMRLRIMPGDTYKPEKLFWRKLGTVSR